MADDVNGPQVIWQRHGRLVQSYGLPSPRQGRPGSRRGGVRVVRRGDGRPHRRRATTPTPDAADPGGRHAPRDARAHGARREPRAGHRPLVVRRPPRARHGAVQPVPQHHRAGVRRHAARSCAPRPGTHVEEAYMDVFAFDARAGRPTRRATKPFDVDAAARRRPAVRPRAQPGRRQLRAHPARAAPARASRTSRCRRPRSAALVNLHRTLEEYLGIGPEDG